MADSPPPSQPRKPSPLSSSEAPVTPPAEDLPQGFQYLVRDDEATSWSPPFSAASSRDDELMSRDERRTSKAEKPRDKAVGWTSGATRDGPTCNISDASTENGRGDRDVKAHFEPDWTTGDNRGFLRRMSRHLAPINTKPNKRSTVDDPLIPLVSPAVQSAYMTPDKPYYPGQPKSLEAIALRAFCLGIVLALAVVGVVSTLVLTSSPLWRLPFFVAALSTFHFLEFWTTAKYNTKEASVNSFLLTSNWPGYFVAHVAATVECLVTNLFWPNRQWAPWGTSWIILLFGLIQVVGGQLIRATSMMQLGSNFNHIVQLRKRQDHELVTTGIYGVLRHPSYFGFFWWGIGTQLVLGNPISFCVYAIVLWNFFRARIQAEEEGLVRFFADEYPNYKKRVPTRIPFIS